MFAKLLTALVLGGRAGRSASMLTSPAPARSPSLSYRAFGRAVAITGEYAFVGEPNVAAFGGRGGRGGAPPAPGLVHVYRLSAGAWKQVDTLVATGPSEGDGFGSSPRR